MCDNSKDLYLSDIYVENDSAIMKDPSDLQTLYRVELFLPFNVDISENKLPQAVLTDQDGDLIVDRENHNKSVEKFIFTLGTQMKTSLDDVGLQLWRASFYLADFLVHNCHLIRDMCVLELGAGIGITSLVAAFYSKRVVCTDLERIVRNAQKNYERNREIILGANTNAEILFKSKLIWDNLIFY